MKAHADSHAVNASQVAAWNKQLKDARHPVAITGAGISVASGLPTLSAAWNGIDLRDFFTYKLYQQKPKQFFHYYRIIWKHWQQAKPNAAHLALAKHGMPIITQNIDGLHQRAGSSHVLELHGNLRELVCANCGAIYASEIVLQRAIPICPTCHNLLKPTIVLVGEEVYHYGTAVDWVGKADLLLVIGTKLEMSPCQELPEIVERKGLPVFYLNHRAEFFLPRLLS